MAATGSCENLPLLYVDPATGQSSSCKELCRFLYLQVRRGDCMNFCPEYFRCLISNKDVSSDRHVQGRFPSPSPSPSPPADPGHEYWPDVTYCLLAAVLAFLVGLVMFGLVYFVKRTFDRRRLVREGRLISRTVEAQVEQGSLLKPHDPLKKDTHSRQPESSAMLPHTVKKKDSISSLVTANAGLGNTYVSKKHHDKTSEVDTKSSDSGFSTGSSHSDASRE